MYINFILPNSSVTPLNIFSSLVVKISKVPNKKKQADIKCFYLDKFRKEKILKKADYLELE